MKHSSKITLFVLAITVIGTGVTQQSSEANQEYPDYVSSSATAGDPSSMVVPGSYGEFLDYNTDQRQRSVSEEEPERPPVQPNQKPSKAKIGVNKMQLGAKAGKMQQPFQMMPADAGMLQMLPGNMGVMMSAGGMQLQNQPLLANPGGMLRGKQQMMPMTLQQQMSADSGLQQPVMLADDGIDPGDASGIPGGPTSAPGDSDKFPVDAAGTKPPLKPAIPPVVAPQAPVDPTVGPRLPITRRCHACGMRGRDAVQNNGQWPACGEGPEGQDTCTGSRMRCYVMYGEWDYEIFGRKVISKGCAYNQWYGEPLVNRRKRETAEDETEEPADDPLDRQKRHSGMFGKGMCSFLDSTVPVHRGWNVTMEMIPMCWCDDRDMCNDSDYACDYDPSVCRDMNPPDSRPRRRSRLSLDGLHSSAVNYYSSGGLVAMVMVSAKLISNIVTN